jgi:hypothetical protein
MAEMNCSLKGMTTYLGDIPVTDELTLIDFYQVGLISL